MSRLVGYGVSQVPTNGMLGGMAYQDPNNVTINNISVGGGTLTGIASQPLQVTGGAYVSGVGVATGSIGVGITNPQGALDIRTSPQWSSFNYGANLIIGGTRNNGIGILDSTNSNPWAIVNAAGTLLFAQMPALGITTSVATEAARITTNRNLLIGSITETGTALQRLQVTGGAYVSGSVGIGITNPTSKLHVVGTSLITGITTVGLGSTSTPPNNSQLSFELITDTNLRIKVRGSDGVLRSANITLS
jgi:hypothetical protein